MHLPVSCGPPKTGSEGCLKYLSRVAQKETSSSRAEEMLSAVEPKFLSRAEAVNCYMDQMKS